MQARAVNAMLTCAVIWTMPPNRFSHYGSHGFSKQSEKRPYVGSQVVGKVGQVVSPDAGHGGDPNDKKEAALGHS
jgi:hypothetical protein